MARNNDLVVTAGLNIETSVDQIEKDLKRVSEKLTADHALKITANIDLGKTTQRIQSQLSTLSKNLSLNLGGLNINSSAINTEVNSVVSTIQKTLGSAANIQLHVDSQPINEFVSRLKDVGVGSKIIDQLKSKLESLNVVITKIVPQFTQLKGGEQQLTSFSITGLDKAGNTIKYLEKFNAETGDFEKSSTKMVSNLVKIQQETKRVEDSAKAAQLAYNDFLKLKGQADVYSKQYAGEDSLKNQLADIQKLIGEFDNTQPLEKQREGIINIDNALKLLKVDIDNIKKASTPVVTKGVSDFYPNIAKGASTQDTISNAKNTLNELFAKTAGMEEDTANRVKRAVEDTTGALQRFYVQVERGDKSIETLTYALNEQGNAYEYLGKVIREADNSTDFRRKDVGTQWQIQSEKLIQFANNADKAGLASTTLKEDIKELFESLNKANPNFGGDTSTMNAFLDKFDIAKAKMQAFNTEARKENATANLQNRIKRLTADVNAYGEANERATKSMKQMSNGKTFAVEWSRITTEMARGADLTDRELKDLSADMAVFRKEAQAAGLAGVGAFERFGNAFKLVSTYISANQVINMVTRNIREAVDELKAVDDRLTEISKTSDRTAESLKNLGLTSFDTASKYGRTASDYLLGVQEMSRAGFAEKASEDMAELSVLAQSAGDMTADLANQYLIATNAAYQYNGSVDKLNDSLDRQNYVTNHYALSMSDLAEATKIAASQAAQSGIGIDEMTAALSTMISTTQQGGEIAARSLRGILMNIQQVKGEVGDGEEDITSASLSKYEKAAEALGVSLKEVRNGAVALRDPMVVLDELASAFNKEADDSIKKANLINAIGGKYRGNQLSALLTNWDTYKDILNTFNSEQAVGSAMTEAEKSANNWAGSLNKVRNSWAELVNQFINSDNAVSIIQSINRMIQSLTESAATGGLKTTANLLSDLVELISIFSEKVGTLPVLLAGIAGIGSFKGKGIFGTITDEIDKSVKHITIFKKQWADIKTDISNPNTKGLSKVGVALEGVKIKAIATEVAVSALNAALTLGLSLAVGLAVKGISKLVDNLVVTKEELAEMRQETLNDLDSLSDSITSLTEDSQTLQGLLSQYKQLSQSTQDISQNKEELLKIQNDLVEQFGDEANNLDLLNDKYDTTIEKIKDLSEAQQTEWRRQHAAEIKRAEDIASLDVNIGSGLTNPVAANKGFVDATNDLVKQLYVIDGLNREFTEYATSLDDVYYVYRSFWGRDDEIALTGTIEEAREQLGQLIDTYKNMDNVDQATLGALTTRYEELGRAIEDVNTYTEQNNLQNNIANVGNSIGNISKTALTSLSEIQTETDNIGNKWFENLDEAQKGSLKTINTVTSALQKIAGGDLLSGDEFWALAKIDTERVLDGAKLVGNQFKVSEEQLIQLKDTYIKKQIETIKAENADLAVKKQQTDELIRQAELEVQALGRRGLSNSAYRTEFEKATEQLRQSKQYSKEYGDSISRNNVLIQQLNASLGNTVDKQQLLADKQKKLNDEISRLNKEADDLLKAQEYVIDQRIKDHENEKKALEDEKKLLEEQLDVLEQQQSELEDMIENYKSIAGVVEDELGKSIENLKKQQEAEENAVQAKIDALKESREQQDEENSLLEKELELKERLANLDKAKSTKVKTFSSARGWHFDVDREAVANAEEEVRAAQKSYDDAVADKAYKDQEKALEQEKDAIAKNYEVEIKAYEDYIQQYKDVLEEETVAENERLAEQILGADWREKISKRDVELLGKFRNEYRSHNNALKTLVNTELAMTKASIEAKDAEIKAKQEQIDAWNQYKTDVQQAAQDIKNANEDYMNYINSVVLPDEANNFVQREINLWNFKENYKAYMDEIASKQAELDSVADSLTNLQDIANGFDLGDLISNLERMTDQFGNALLTVDEFEKMWEDTYEKQKRMGIINSASAAYVMGSHSEGGVADYTGLAMLHGTKQKSETIFNANDSAKLYDMIHNTPNLMADMVSKAVKISRPTIANSNTTNNPIFNIQRMEINGVQNPKEFTEAFNKNIEAYWKTKLTENRVK